MKQTLYIILCMNFICAGHSQGITLLFKGGGNGNWDDPVNWIQSNTPVGQTPIQRAPTELDDVVFSSTQSGISTVLINFNSSGDSIVIGKTGTTGYRCRSMHVSNTDLSLGDGTSPNTIRLDVYTTNGGYVLIDSGSNFRYGHFVLHGGNPQLNDLEIVNSTFGSLFSANDWSWIQLSTDGNARFVGSTLGGYFLGFGDTGGHLYAENCKFFTSSFSLGDNSSATILNSSIENDINNPNMNFHIGKNANFVSSNVNIKSFSFVDFFTSGSTLNGNVSLLLENSYGFHFNQEDPANPLPNIINGDLEFIQGNGTMGISGDVKISGNVVNNAVLQLMYYDTSHVFVNNQDIFKIAGIKNYGNDVSLSNCVEPYCHFKMEFFGNTNTNINWPVGFPIDTLIVNKSGCAKVTVTNSLYVSGEARIQSGQLVLNPNVSIAYKCVCAGNLNISEGGGVFLRRDDHGAVANIAVGGTLNDLNLVADSTCTGFSNPYNGDISLYRTGQNGGNNLINIAGSSNIGDLHLIGQTGSDFILGGNLSVNDFSFDNNSKLLLGDHDLIVNGKIFNYGPTSYFVTNGSGKLQINNIGNIETVFPVGPSISSYNPAGITNAGTADNFRVNIQSQVLSGGTTGNPYISGIVNRTWNVDESTAGASDVALTLQWNAEDELTGFTRSASYLSHYISGAWDNGIQMSASGSNPFSITRTHINSFSPFAVMGASALVPVSLLDFKGNYKERAISLDWITETELNTGYFTVEKSIDAVYFKPLTNIPASGNSQGRNNYHYVDHTFLNPINYYRLKIVDFDGRSVYSKIITVTTPADHKFVVFPNPVKDKLYIPLQIRATETVLRVVDTKGRTVRTFKLKAGTAGTSINIADLPAGIYLLLLDAGKLKETLQFIKQ